MGSITGHVSGEVTVDLLDFAFVIPPGHYRGEIVAVHDDVNGIDARVGGDSETVAEAGGVVSVTDDVRRFAYTVDDAGGVVEGLAEDEVEGVCWDTVGTGADDVVVLTLNLRKGDDGVCALVLDFLDGVG